MTNQDSAEDKALEAANAISTEVCRLWMEAHAAGVRNGINLSAQFLTTSLEVWREDAFPLGGEQVADLIEQLRDGLLLLAFQTPDPEPPTLDGEVAGRDV